MQHEMHLQNRNSSGVMMVGGNGYDNKRRRTGMPGQMVAGGMRQPPYPQYGGNNLDSVADLVAAILTAAAIRTNDAASRS